MMYISMVPTTMPAQFFVTANEKKEQGQVTVGLLTWRENWFGVLAWAGGHQNTLRLRQVRSPSEKRFFVENLLHCEVE
jgi:hypothetical protein